jgi:type II secretory ATPase GspE/PulE/Tfp pilus assembly ATPase PilB-like protein
MSVGRQVEDLKREVEYGLALREITNRIHSARDLNEILINMKDDILRLFDAERITIYAVDGIHKELYSRFKVGNETSEIRVPISSDSIAGHTSCARKIINIQDAYNDEQLKKINTNLKFDKTWDIKSGYKTIQILASPIIFDRYLLGVIQLINKKSGDHFTLEDKNSITEMAKILGIAFYNQIKMSKRQVSKLDYLLDHNIITTKELDRAVKEARSQGEDVESVLMRRYKVSKEDIGKSLSDFYDCRYVGFNEKNPVPDDLLADLRVSYLRKNLWIPLESKNDKVIIGIDDPADLQRTDFIKSRFRDKSCEFVVALKEDILSYINLFFTKEGGGKSISDILSKLDDEEDVVFATEMQEVSENDSIIVQLVNRIISDACDRDASDIHIETYPGRRNTDVRLRIDGVCIPYESIPYGHKMAVISRIKIMSQLDIAERRLPQDGKIKFKLPGNRDIELRVATIPTAGGTEDIVMRVLATDSEQIPMGKLGMTDRNVEKFKEIIQNPYGIILVAGPTGSGKTTTLHSALGFINTPERKIWTVEDPIEITQYGLRQVQVKPKIGLDFAAAVRAFLRADPDVIMIGEMRDTETASAAIKASLTGHLVFSTLHTNSAPETVTRLLDMGMDPFNFSDALLGVLAQRLIRVLCKECKEPYELSLEGFDTLVCEYGEEYFKDLSITYNSDIVLYRPVGCEACNNTGYKGRTGIFELLTGSDDIKALIQNKARVEEIRNQAMKEGMRTLRQDGIERVIKGYTDIKHIRTVCMK